MKFNTADATTNKKGFTLIELLVVIAIIGLLASVVMASLGISRTRAETAKLLADYKSVANALELYRQANAGQYPGTVGEATNINDLIANNGPLSEYLKQSPSASANITTDGIVYFFLNDSDPAESRYWCGETENPQDYVLFLNYPTAAAIESNFFAPISSGVIGSSLNVVQGPLCIPVNQK